MTALVLAIAIGISWALVIFQAGRNNRRFLYLVGFLLPFFSLSLGFIVQFSWFKIVTLVLVLGVLVSQRRIYRPDIALLAPVALLLAYGGILTAVSLDHYRSNGAVAFAAALGGDPDFLVRNMIVQYLHFALLITSPLLFITFVRSRQEVAAITGGYIAGNIVNVVVGIYQSIASLSFLPFFNFWFPVDSLGRTADGTLGQVTISTGLTFSRMAGLGGEPRHFAAFLGIAIVLIMANAVSNNPLAMSKQRFKVAFLGFGLLASLSVSSLLGVIASGAVFGIYAASGKIRGRFRRDVIRSLPLVVLLVFGATIFLQFNSEFKTLVFERIYQRADSFEVMFRGAPRDGLTYRLLLDDSYVALAGAGAGGPVFHTLEQWVEDGRDPKNNLAPSSFWIKFVGEYGLIGGGLLLWLLLVMIRHTRNSEFGRLAYLFVLAGGVLTVFASLMAFSVLVVFVSVFYAHACRTRTVVTPPAGQSLSALLSEPRTV